jgi:hypothetical protein
MLAEGWGGMVEALEERLRGWGCFLWDIVIVEVV